MLKTAEDRLSDPDVARIIARLVRRVQGQPYESGADEAVD
jgi:hypothetical protein